MYVPAEQFDFYEYYLLNGLKIDGCGRDEVPYVQSAMFPNGISMELKVCNAETEGGGAYVDPVLFVNNGKYWNEVACGDVLDSLDNDVILEYNGDEYKTIVKRGYSEE